MKDGRRVRSRTLGLVLIAVWFTGPAASHAGAQVTRFISDLEWASEVNGWGPAERDQSNGELGSGDGGTLSIGGTTYVKGLGVHAHSEIRVQLGGACTAFDAVVGLDDEV